MTIGGAKLVVALTEHKIIAVNLADGKPAWETAAAGADMRAYNAATPIVDGQTLFYCGGGQGVTAVKIEKDGDKVTAKPLWHSDKSVMFSTPVLKDGQLYGLTPSNELFCLNAENGQALWSAPLGGFRNPTKKRLGTAVSAPKPRGLPRASEIDSKPSMKRSSAGR